MFENAIEHAVKFTRAIHSIGRNYSSKLIQPGTASLFFINADGWALTCRHVAQALLGAEQLGQKRSAFQAEYAAQQGQKKNAQILRELERKYQFNKNMLFELYNNFVNCIEGPLNYELRMHPALDMALIHFTGFTRLLCDTFPTFPDQQKLRAGAFLCRIGFPFPEFSNFEYDKTGDRIRWTSAGRTDTPWFPIEGMFTRFLIDNIGVIEGFELSTPGLRGQSGGPAFDSEGTVWGMQSATAHLDLDFDVNQDVIRNGLKRRVSDSTFLHVGHCIHADMLKKFMTDNQVTFQTTP